VSSHGTLSRSRVIDEHRRRTLVFGEFQASSYATQRLLREPSAVVIANTVGTDAAGSDLVIASPIASSANARKQQRSTSSSCAPIRLARTVRSPSRLSSNSI